MSLEAIRGVHKDGDVVGDWCRGFRTPFLD